MTSEATDVFLAGLPVAATPAAGQRQPIELIASQFLDAHRGLLNPQVEDYVRTYPQHSSAIRRIFPVLMKLERAKWESHKRLLSAQFPLGLPVRQIGLYRLKNELRRTSSTISYQAVDSVRDKHVGLTLVPWKAREVPMLRLRFLREASIAARLRHEGIFPISDYGLEAGYCYAVTPLWEGICCHSVIAEATVGSSRDCQPVGFDAVKFYRIARQLTLALQYAHSRGTLHNNIRPSSIFFGRFGNAYLRGFRVSYPEFSGMPWAEDGARSSVYLPPECLSTRADERSDIFSLGITLYELACRRFVTEFKSDFEVVGAESQLPRWVRGERGSKIPQALLQLLRKATAVRPENRFQTATAMADAILRLSCESTDKPKASPLPIRRWLSRLIGLSVASS